MTDLHTDANPFPVTQWTLVIDSRDQNSEIRKRALEELCSRYWTPIYAYARRLNHSPADSEDLTQGFFSMMLTRDDFGRADRDRGKFRAYVRTAFRNFVSDFHKMAKAKKRGGDVVIFSIDQQVGEDRFREFEGNELSPEKAFDRDFAIAVLERAASRLRVALEGAGKGEHFKVMRPFLEDTGMNAPSYADVAASLQISESAAKSAVHRFRGQYRNKVIAEIQDTLGAGDDLDAELQYLLDLFN